MSGRSSRAGAWWSALEPPAEACFHGRGDPGDPRLGEVTKRWVTGAPELPGGRPILIGFPCDEGVRRNHGRPGAAAGPDAVRQQLYRLTPWDPITGVDLGGAGLSDLGNVRVADDLEASQERLGGVLGQLFGAGAVPVLLGGGHETTFGHYLGYAAAGIDTAIINVDAHLDVRPYAGGAHSGSPFRQAFEHPTWPLKTGRYVVIGAQRQSVAREHWRYVTEHGGRVHWAPGAGAADEVLRVFAEELGRLARECEAVLLTVDADAFRQADVPGCSAPNPTGLDGRLWPEIAGLAGAERRVRSIDLVEVNPAYDRDGQTARWAAVGVRQFLVAAAKARGYESV